MRVFIIALAVLYWAGVSLAATMVTGQDECPVLPELAFLNADDANAGDLNAWRATAGGVRPIVDIDVVESPPANQVFARFRADPASGAVIPRRGSHCSG